MSRDTVRGKVERIESLGFVVSEAVSSSGEHVFCVWDPDDDGEGYCVRGPASVLDDALGALEEG